jgi:anti-sigma factor RsiW
MTDHLGDIAALYALGALDEDERRLADEHLDSCDACRRLLAQAEADVAAIEATRVHVEPPAQLRKRLEATLATAPRASGSRGWLTAIAAAVIVALLPAGYLLRENASMHSTMATEAQALARIATSPHRVARFDGMDAHVMYGSDGSWYCVVIRGARTGIDVVWPHDGVHTMLGRAMPHGDVALLYLPKSHRMDRLMIWENGRTVGQAQLVF